MTRLLVVDDDITIRTLLEEHLSECGFEVTTANNGVEAKKFIESEHKHNPFALILVDMQMPEMNGLEFTKYIRSSNTTQSLPVVMLTAEDRELDIKKGYQAGVDAYLLKPCEMNSIINEIKEQLSKK